MLLAIGSLSPSTDPGVVEQVRTGTASCAALRERVLRHGHDVIAVNDKGAYAESMAHLHERTVIDWIGCPLVEVIPGKVSGVPLLKGTRLPADTVLSNFEAGSPVDEISDNFDMPEETIRELLLYAANKQKQLLP